MTNKTQQKADRSIALIGYRGSGKTTVGRALAAVLRLPLVDTDEMIVQAAGMPISRVFSQEGEDRFREREKLAIAFATASRPAIISVGGGAILDPKNVAALKTSATIVWLTASVDILVERIERDPETNDSRPALTNQPPREEVQHVMRERLPLYEQAADHTVDTKDRTPDEIAGLIVSLLQA